MIWGGTLDLWKLLKMRYRETVTGILQKRWGLDCGIRLGGMEGEVTMDRYLVTFPGQSGFLVPREFLLLF